MSTPKKNNSLLPKNKNIDDSATPRRAKDVPSSPQTNESTENYASNASTSVNKTSVVVEPNEQLGLNAIIQNHQEFLVDKYLADARLNRNTYINDSRQKVMQTEVSKLQAEIKKRVKELSILPSVRNDLANIVADVEKKIEICDIFVGDLSKDYAIMTGHINQKMENIGHVHTNIKKLNQMTNDQQEYFERECQLQAHKLDKINREIDFVQKERNEVALQLSKSNRVISQMAKDHAKLQKTNKRLTEQIDKKKREKEVNDKAFTAMHNNVKHCINEKKETIKRLDEEKIELKKVQANLLVGLGKAKDKLKKLRQDEVELTAKTSNQKNLIARVKTANKNLRAEEAANNAEFKQNYSRLSDKLKKITDKNAEMQCAMNKKQEQWDKLKRLQEDILKKQQIHNELQLQSVSLKKENADSVEAILKARKNINEVKFRNDSEANTAISYAKRLRLYSSTTDEAELQQMEMEMEMVSNSSSVKMKDLEVSMNDNDFDSISSFNTNM